ncbi:MAG: type I methionyl aminopeptidase [Candidatus Nephthysia bennettiae]|uniref:Methionine aminopeptidase n=1 Tax=Candidatus Nephthysia bennettiae TaxID=3127016 RepID=A0A934K7W0_9BACT|nr:type I methionyl aminopeptidase [Candidatus Dormibacteraeota bacterium]MBJ7612033.1 type I methionyl aminopeptidase [Candidatus Dormibacteraeota bacterium]PZR89604.1 MAG: type I methionyl aminopeptidase [Candidatus Dormibacteraeota bacterium]
MINLKTNHEIELMARAGQVLEGVVEELKGAIRPGVRTIELDRLAERRMRAAGARPGFLGYHGFPNSICVSINDEAVHGIPGRRRILDGDIVSLDLGLVLEGFWADMGCTVAVGKVSSEAERLIQVTEECLDVAVRHAQPGGHLGDISAAVQQHAEAAGFSVIRQFVGHGIGRQMHEDPQVPNFGLAGTGPELRPGMTLAIEPMVNQGSQDVYIKPDGWTVCTSDGSLSAYFEHTVAITREGPRILTRSSGASDRKVRLAG